MKDSTVNIITYKNAEICFEEKISSYFKNTNEDFFLFEPILFVKCQITIFYSSVGGKFDFPLLVVEKFEWRLEWQQ